MTARPPSQFNDSSPPGMNGCCAIGLVAVTLLALQAGCRQAPTAQTKQKQPPEAVANTVAPVPSNPAPVTAKNTSENEGRAPANQPAQVANKIEPHPEVGKFNEAQLGKDHTLFVLAFDSITRQTYFLSNFRHLMNDEQVRQTRELVDSYEGRYAELRDERARILENATDDQDIDTMLLNNRVTTLLLGRDLRRKLFREILTEEQQKLHLEESAERRARREALEKAAAEAKQSGSSP